MPENKQQIPQPRNILEVINLNVYSVSQDLHTAMNMIVEQGKEIAALRAMLTAPVPEQPNAAPGNEGTVNE